MTLIQSISGIRGTIGGKTGLNLTPLDTVKYVTAFAQIIQIKKWGNSIVVGRDARISGSMIEKIVVATLQSKSFNVINLGMATTPTVEHAVIKEKAAGGIIITASHNPKEWNALKLLNNQGEFLDSNDGALVLEYAHSKLKDIEYSDVNNLGNEIKKDNYGDYHIDRIVRLPIVNSNAIKNKKFKVAIDCVNSVGALVIPKLLKRLGVDDIFELYCEPNGLFPHNPEPLPENLTEISKLVTDKKADVGFVVDPDVDRLAIICEDGTMFGEEYTLVAVADYVLSKTLGNTVSNMSSTRALKDVTENYGKNYYYSAVGEVNVVSKMKEVNAVIGGEGNGGVIYPESHYGRDALVGIALFLSLMAEKNMKVSDIKGLYPPYFISKNKIKLDENLDVEKIFENIASEFKKYPISREDGIRIDFPENKEWVQIRKSNTEPIIRIYAESINELKAKELAKKISDIINQ